VCFTHNPCKLRGSTFIINSEWSNINMIIKRYYLGLSILFINIFIYLLTVGCNSNVNNYPYELMRSNILKSESLLNNDISVYSIRSDTGQNGNLSNQELFETLDVLERLKQFNDELNACFNVFELQTQWVYFIGYYNGDNKFVDSNDLVNSINQKVYDNNGYEILCTPLKTVFVGEKVYNHFNNKIIEGRNFSESDFHIYKSDQAINIILGAEYQKTYEINDNIYLSLHQNNMEFKVIGFLDYNTEIKFPNGSKDHIIFDESIIIPFYNINYSPTNEYEDYYQKIYYHQKNQCLIEILGTDRDPYITYIDEIKKINEKNITEKSILNVYEKLLKHETYQKYANIVSDLADKYDLYYSIPLMPYKISRIN